MEAIQTNPVGNDRKCGYMIDAKTLVSRHKNYTIFSAHQEQRFSFHTLHCSAHYISQSKVKFTFKVQNKLNWEISLAKSLKCLAAYTIMRETFRDKPIYFIDLARLDTFKSILHAIQKSNFSVIILSAATP